MQVLKFGGSSVATAQNFKKVIEIVKQNLAKEKTVVVVSALGSVTDLLLAAANAALVDITKAQHHIDTIATKHKEVIEELLSNNFKDDILILLNKYCKEIEDLCKGIFLLGELSSKTKDKIVCFGELLSSQIISATLKVQKIENTWLDARKLIVTDNNFEAAIVHFSETNKLIYSAINENENNLFIVPGFIAADADGNTTTLGRGGSDYTASIFAAAVNATSLDIYTDVSGMMTADPRIVNNYKLIPTISYQEAMELSHFGAKVIYPPTIQPVMVKNIPVKIKNTFVPTDEGTVITNEQTPSNTVITGISSINKLSLISLEGSGMVGIPGFSKRLFEALASQKINVILITQSSSEHSISVGIETADVQKAKTSVDAAFEYEINIQKVEPLIIENNLAIVALVGDQMKNHTGVSGKMFHTLGSNGINIRAIAQGSSERNISAVISTSDVVKAVNILHEAFFETTYKQVHLYLAGVGNVGSILLTQLQQQLLFLKEQLLLNIKVVGIANSKAVLINDDGIDLASWKQQIQTATSISISEYANLIIEKNNRNSIFIDVTANNEVASVYEKLLTKSIAVVACNKIACSSDFNYYKSLKKAVKEYNAHFLFETNVGAGLPIISTLKDLINSGDKINKIEAVLSGTLNFVFNNYDGNTSFSSVVKQAQAEGYTEPDPRLDLSGKDVMRKIMILAREAGEAMQMDEITNSSFMPQSCMQGSVENFYAEMEKEEQHFKNLLEKANKNNCKLKFVATYEPNGNDVKATVGLQQIPSNHDFFHLYGKDNIVLFYTNRYPTQPLVVKGAGAGAAVTASGVFADIIRATQR